MTAMITVLSDPPARPTTEPVQWSVDMHAYLSQFGPLTEQINAANAELLDRISYAWSGSSTDDITIGTGVKVIAADEGMALIPGHMVLLSARIDPANQMVGLVQDYDPGDGTLTVDVTAVEGSGDFEDWAIGLYVSVDLTDYATEAYVDAAADDIIDGAPSDLNTLNKLATAIGDDDDFAGTVATALAAKAALTGPQTMSATRITKRVITAGATSGTITPTGDTADLYKATGLTGTITFAVPSGTPTDGQKLELYWKDNGSSRTTNWTTSAGGFRAADGVTLPSATTTGKWHRAGCIYNGDDSFWDVVAVAKQA